MKTAKTTPEQNKALVLEAFDTLFNKRDYDAASRFWSDVRTHHCTSVMVMGPIASMLMSAPESEQDAEADGHGSMSAPGRRYPAAVRSSSSMSRWQSMQ